MFDLLQNIKSTFAKILKIICTSLHLNTFLFFSNTHNPFNFIFLHTFFSDKYMNQTDYSNKKHLDIATTEKNNVPDFTKNQISYTQVYKIWFCIT